MKRKITTLIICCATACGALAQGQTRQLTLDDCRRLAVENNASVKIARGKAREAEETKREAFTKYFPTVAASAIGFLANKPILYHDFAGMFSLGLIKHGTGASLYALQPVFAGGQIVNGNRLAKVGAEAGALQVENAADEARLKAEEDYWQIVVLKSKKSTLQSVINMIDTLQTHVDVAVKAGVLLPNELLKVKLRHNEMQTLMVDLDNGIDLATKALAQFVGLDGTPVDIAMEPVPETLPEYPRDAYVTPSQALASTTDYRLLDKQAEAADLSLRITAGSNLPTVAAGAGLFYDDLINDRYSYGAFMVNVSIPISGWWGGSHAIKKSKIAKENAETQKEDLSQMLMLNMTNNWDKLTASYRKMEIAHQSIAQASENLRLNQNYYRAGVSTVTELLDAQTLYRQAQDTYTESYGNFRTAYARYLDSTGRDQ